MAPLFFFVFQAQSNSVVTKQLMYDVMRKETNANHQTSIVRVRAVSIVSVPVSLNVAFVGGLVKPPRLVIDAALCRDSASHIHSRPPTL
jgi:hypothetical protein